MKRITFRLTVAVVTFLTGVAVIAAWRRPSAPTPVPQVSPGRDVAEDISPLPPQIVFNLDGHKIPRRLQTRLAERLQLFVGHQRSDQWGGVKSLLGEFHGVSREKKYTANEKEVEVARIRLNPLMSFTPRCVTWSTAILNKLPEEKWWTVTGDAEYGDGNQGQAHILVYLHGGEWYFMPLHNGSRCPDWPASNNGMHPTPRHGASHDS